MTFLLLHADRTGVWIKVSDMIYRCHYNSPLCGITLESDGESLTGLSFDRQDLPMESDSVCDSLPVFALTKEWLDIYFSKNIPDFTPPIVLHTTPFRKAVYDILMTIPYGQTMTYGEIAAIIAARKSTGRMSAQAVGGAVGHNPIGIIIPCHRVIGTGGKLTGYAAGLDKKSALLALEGIIPSATL